MKRYIADAMLLLVTFAWGTTFVLVQDAISRIPVFTFLTLRFVIAGVILLFIGAFLRKTRSALGNSSTWWAGLMLGFWLFAGYALQTLGLLYTTAARSGFITGLSVVLVPLFSVWLLKQRPLRSVWWGAAMATLGLFSLSGLSQNGLNLGDLLTLFCAVSFAIQIILVGKYASHSDPLALATIQIITVGILSALMIPITHTNVSLYVSSLSSPIVIEALAICIVFATILAYFVQTAVQRFTTTTHTALIFSLEPVFAAVTAYIWSNSRLTILEIIGSLLILAGMLVAEFTPANPS